MRGLGRLFDDVISQQLANPPDLVIQSRLKVIFLKKIEMTKKGQRTLGNRLGLSMLLPVTKQAFI